MGNYIGATTAPRHTRTQDTQQPPKTTATDTMTAETQLCVVFVIVVIYFGFDVCVVDNVHFCAITFTSTQAS